MLTLLRCLAVLCALAGPVASQSDPGGAPAGDGGAGDPVDLLIEVLEDEAARQALLERLRAAESAGADGDATDGGIGGALGGVGAALGDAADAVADTVSLEEPASLGRQIAQVTQEGAEALAARLARFWSRVQNLPTVLSNLDQLSLPLIVDTLGELLILIAATVSVFVVMRGIARIYYARFGARAVDASALVTVGLYLLSVAIDFAIVLVAWAIGYAITTLALGDFGQVGIRQSLYLNAFLVVETLKVGIRMVISPSTGRLRIVPIEDGPAKYLYRRISIMVGLVGYGALLVVPIVNQSASFAAGRALTAALALVVLGIAVTMVLRKRRAVAEWLRGPEDVRRDGPLSGLAAIWHLPVLVYLFGMFVVVVSNSSSAIFATFATSGQVVLVFLAGMTVTGWLNRILRDGIRLSDNMREMVPLLEERLNRVVPRLLMLLRVVILVVVALFALDAIDVIDFWAPLGTARGLATLGTSITVAIVLLIAFGLWLAMHSYVDYRLNDDYGQAATARERTLLTLARNAGTIALLILTLMFVLAEIGLNIAPLIASAGVLGLAIGFGAQKLVQDIITGLFIQFENAINVGDVVTAGGTTGAVEKLTVRSVSLRDLEGVLHIVPFSSVDMVSNYMRGFSYYLCDMGVAYREDIDEARAAMLEAFEVLKGDEIFGPKIIGDLEWFGVQALGDSAVILRARVKTYPGEQWGVGRAYNEYLKKVFDAHGIEIPFPHQTVYLGESKDGHPQTLPIDIQSETATPPGSRSETGVAASSAGSHWGGADVHAREDYDATEDGPGPDGKG